MLAKVSFDLDLNSKEDIDTFCKVNLDGVQNLDVKIQGVILTEPEITLLNLAKDIGPILYVETLKIIAIKNKLEYVPVFHNIEVTKEGKLIISKKVKNEI